MTPQQIIRAAIEHLEEERKWYVTKLVELDFELAQLYVKLGEILNEKDNPSTD